MALFSSWEERQQGSLFGSRQTQIEPFSFLRQYQRKSVDKTLAPQSLISLSKHHFSPAFILV
jgi:hypothetical protein